MEIKKIGPLTDLLKDILMDGMNNVIPGNRKHHPNGPSRLPRRVFCPKSGQLEIQIPLEEDNEPKEEAKLGTLLHSFCLTDNNSNIKIPEEQRWLANRANDWLKSRTKSFCQSVDYEDWQYGYEVRVEVPNLYWGWADYVLWKKGDHVEIDELKFGPGNYSKDFIRYQGLALSLPVLLAKPVYEAKYVDFAAFHVYSGTELVERFEAKSADALLIEVEGILEMAKDPKAKAIPSEEACRYCRAKSICEAFKSEIRAPVPAGPESQALWSPAEWSRALELSAKVNIWERWAAQVRARAKELMIKGALKIPGWEVGTRYVREVTDVQGAYQALSNIITQSEFLGACEVPIGKLENIFVERFTKKNGGTKKDAKDQMTEILTGSKSLVVNLQSYLKKEQI